MSGQGGACCDWRLLTMRILYVAPRVPYPPTKGDKIRAFHQIRELAKQHAVHLICGIDPKDDGAGLEALRRYCTSIEAVSTTRMAIRLRVAGALFRGRPQWAFSHREKGLGERVWQKLRAEKFDAILGSSVAVAECLRGVNDVPKALDFVDTVSELWRAAAEYRRFPASSFYRVEARRLARYEQEIARSFDCSIFVSEAEARLFRRRGFDLPVSVVGNGVDLEYFSPSGESSRRGESPTVVFTGTMDYFPNADAVRHFCRSIFPTVRAAVPGVHFYVVGRDPTRPVRALARERQVTVTAAVADVRVYLAHATVAVAPFRVARGVQNKVLEAMAMGVPVVGTSQAFEGLELIDGDGARRADDPHLFSEELAALLTDASWRRRCSRQARRYVEQYHRWDVQGARLNEVLNAIVGTERKQHG